MKKLSIILTIIISFLFMSNVNAKTETATYKFTSDKNAIINTYNMTNEEIKNYTSTYKVASDSITNRIADNFIKLREYYENNYKSKYDYYIIINYLNYSGGYFQLFAFNEDSINQKLGNMINSSSYYKILAVNFFNLSANKFESVYLDNNNKFKTSSSTYNTYVYSGGDTNSFNINYQSTYYETNYNMDISLSSTGHNSIVYNSFTYDSKIYYPNDFLFNTMTSNELNRLKDTKPKINISSTLKNELGEKIKINFSEFDKEKFIYLYNFNNQPGNENWHEITENDYEYSTLLNGTLYVKMIDREQFLLNGDTTPVVSATYTLTDLLMYEDVIDTYNMSDYAEIEYRYYGNNPAMFYYTTYRYGEVPEDTYCITGTGIYECNILNIKEITSNFYYYTTIETEESEYLYKRIFAYEDSPTYSIKEYDHAVIEDFSKYPVNSDFFYNHYRSFTLDLSMYLKEENRGRYVYVYYSTDIYDKTIKTSQSSWNNDTNTNNKLDDLNSETIKPPTYQENTEKEDNYFLGFFIDLINKKFPIINQLSFIISTFSIKENDDIPNLTVDLSSMGIPGEVTIIDIETYKQCREMLFFFEYFGICMIGIPKIINNIKSSLGGDK